MYRELLSAIVARGVNLGLSSSDLEQLRDAATRADAQCASDIPEPWLTELRARLGRSRTTERRALGTFVSALFHEAKGAREDARSCREAVRRVLRTSV